VPALKSPSTPKPASGGTAATVNGEMYISDGDYIKDIEVNDLRNRYTHTKGSTQKMVIHPLAYMLIFPSASCLL